MNKITLSIICTRTFVKFVTVIIGLTANISTGALTLDDAGWSVFNQTNADRTIYVSSSVGDDRNTGLNENQPVATLKYAKKLLRNGYADHLLFRTGDRFGPLGRWTHSGRSHDEMMLVGSYGDGPRPIFNSGRESNLTHHTKLIAHVAFVGLHLTAPDRIYENNTSAVGFQLLANTDDILFENCRVELYQNAFVFQKLWGKMRDIRVRRCVILNSFATEQHASGIYAQQVDGLIIEQNLFDHNGWLENPNSNGPNAPPTKFNHNIYIQHGTTGVIVRDNIFARGASHGAQVRNGGVIENNLFLDNAIGLMVTSDEPPPFAQQIIRRNVVMHASNRKLDDGRARGWGYDIFRTSDRTTIDQNIAAHSPDAFGESQSKHLLQNFPNGIKIYQWANETNSDILTQPASNPQPDPNRTIATYHQAIGRPASLLSFLYEARKQSKRHWQPAYTAAAVNQYIRSGFGMDDNPTLLKLNPVEPPSSPFPLVSKLEPDSLQPTPTFTINTDGQWIIEAEQMKLNGFEIETRWPITSERACIGLAGDANTGTATATFYGPAGSYDLRVRYFDENDGNTPYQIHLDGQLVTSWVADKQLGSNRPDIKTIVETTVLRQLALTNGQTITLSATVDQNDYARVDKIILIPTDFESNTPDDTTTPTPPQNDLPDRINNLESRLDHVESRLNRAAQSLAD